MKATRKVIHWPEDRSLHCRRRCEPKFEFDWHFHPEYQLELLVRGKERLFVGDRILDFQSGQLLLLGPNLPHSMLTEAGASKTGRKHESVVVQFPEDFLGSDALGRPELRPIQQLLERAHRGLIYSVDQCRHVVDRLSALPERHVFERFHDLLWILHTLAQTGVGEPLTSETFRAADSPSQCERINQVCDYIQRHIAEDLTESKIASLIHLTPSAFSRFFKRATGLTFVDYVNGIRIGRACRRLIETDDSVLEISLAVGFGNKSHFNRQFKRRKGMTPLRFRQAHRSAELS